MNATDHATDTRDRILKTAARMFSERGYEGTSVRDIVNVAGVNLGAITYHFGGKEQLLMEVIAEKVKPLKEIGMRIVAGRSSAKQRLALLLREYAYQVLCRDPDLRLLFAEGVHVAKDSTFSHIHEAMKKRNDIVASLIRECMAEGSFRPCDVDGTVWMFFGMIMPFVVHQPQVILGQGKTYSMEFVERIVNNALDIMFHGLCPPETRAAPGNGKSRRK